MTAVALAFLLIGYVIGIIDERRRSERIIKLTLLASRDGKVSSANFTATTSPEQIPHQ